MITFRDTRLAVGLLGQRTEYGPLQPTVFLVVRNVSQKIREIGLTENGNWENQEKINKEKLEVSEIRSGLVQYADRRKLDCRVQAHVLKATKTRNQRRSPLSAKIVSALIFPLQPGVLTV